MTKIMTKRFCGMRSYPLQLPLVHPTCMMTDLAYEKKIDAVVTPPISMRARHFVAKNVKETYGITPG